MHDDDRPSKTRRKQDMHALQALGVALVELSEDQLAGMELPDDLRSAVQDAKRIRSREGHRRQLQYIGRLMRTLDPEPISAQLDRWRGRSREATAALHAIERWRERLLSDDGALTEFAASHPGADLQALRVALRETRKERLAGAPPRHFRVLFQLLREALSSTKL